MEEMLIGVTDRTTVVFIPDSASTDGSGKTGLVAANLTVSFTRVETDNDVTVADATGSLNDLASLTAAHNDWGWYEVSNTVAPGLYRLDLADAVFASGAWMAVVYVMVTTSAAAATPKAYRLVAVNALDAAAMGMTLVPANVTQLSGDSTAADNAEAFFDGTGYAGTNNVIPLVTTTTTATTAAAIGVGGIVATSFGAGAIDAAAIAAAAIGASELADGAITAAKIATGAIDADALAADAIDEIWDETIGDSTVTARQAMKAFIASLAGKLSGAATTTVTIRNVADDTDVIVATVDGDGNRTAVTLTV